MNHQYNSLDLQRHVFSSRSMGSLPRHPRRDKSRQPFSNVFTLGLPIRPVMVDDSLLTPLPVGLDPTLHTVKEQEKEQIKSLNNQFASYIDKVRHLEQQNKILETKWQLMQDETRASSDLEPAMKAYITTLQAQLHGLEREKDKWDSELQRTVSQVEEIKQRYEDEINRKTSAENDFVLAKQDTDICYLATSSLRSKVAGLEDELIFLRTIHDQELEELQEELQETFVVVQMDNGRDLNMEQIVADVKRQYEDMTARSREDVQAWHESKLKLSSSQSELYDFEMRAQKKEISELNRHITRLQADVTSAKAQCDNVDGQIAEAEHRGEKKVQEADQKIEMLKEKLQESKQKMAEQVRTYQELMNIKMALDIEIATYEALLTEEENRASHYSEACHT
ncbi:intermediate filament protein ON3 isoform X2 [Brachyhypopomus gauderio]|uniref:intermediate filament protein ON3 isoform X2 n=1 Tax=Brachyhypopomus gauderio TaxID=698409 RepID=UPI004041FB62